MRCATCNSKECYGGRDCTSIRADAIAENKKEENLRVMKASAEVESEGYMRLTRLEELILFSKKMGYRKLGLAFCVGLEDEARIVYEVLARDFEVSSVCCKVCGISKKDLGLAELSGGGKGTCNPIGQAMLLNDEETDLNIILGLCIGHDILFTKHSKAPVTTFAVKDRVLTHNPLGVVYSKYYKKRRFNIK